MSFLWEDIDRKDILKELIVKAEIEDVIPAPGAIIWRVDRNDQTKSRMVEIVGTDLYERMTIRNCNTVRRRISRTPGTAADRQRRTDHQADRRRPKERITDRIPPVAQTVVTGAL